MATIAEEIDSTYISSNVIETSEFFNNQIKQNYPSGKEYQYGTGVYQNTGADIIVQDYDSGATYDLGDVVYDSNYVKKITSTTGEFRKQPETYSAVDTSYEDSDWTERYQKFKDIPIGADVNGTTKSDFSDSGLPSLNSAVFSPDGIYMFVIEHYREHIYQYTLSTPWDLSTSTYNSKFTVPITIKEISFSPDGLKMYLLDVVADTLSEYNLGTPWSLGTSVFGTSIPLTLLQDGMYFSPDGLMFFVGGYDGGHLVHKYTMSSAWDISTATLTTTLNYSGGLLGYIPRGISFNSTGTKMFIGTSNGITEYTLGAWDISAVVYTTTKEVNSSVYTQGITFSPDGTHVFESEFDYTGNPTKLHHGFLSTPWDISTLYYSTFPASYSETRISDGLLYEYKIYQTSNGTVFKSYTENGGTYSEWMNVLTSLDDTSLENKAITTPDGSWNARTLIIRPDGLYIRTSVDADVEYETIANYSLTTVNYIYELTGFVYNRPINSYRVFDNKNNTPATAFETMSYTLQSNESFNSFTLAKVKANSITYTFRDSDGIEVKTATVAINCQRDPDGILSLYPTTVIFYADEQIESGGYIDFLLSLDLEDKNITLGDLTLNNAISGGLTNLEFNHSVQDYNDYTPDAWGVIPEATKAIVTKFNITTDVYLENYD